jgi:hypothetical protein
MKIWRMRIACWIPKATNTHSKYVILTAFQLQQWLHERASMLRYISIAYLIFVMLAYSRSVNSGGRVEICQIGPRLIYDRIWYIYIYLHFVYAFATLQFPF